MEMKVSVQQRYLCSSELLLAFQEVVLWFGVTVQPSEEGGHLGTVFFPWSFFLFFPSGLRLKETVIYSSGVSFSPICCGAGPAATQKWQVLYLTWHKVAPPNLKAFCY